MSDRSFSLIMLMTIAIFAVIVLLIPVKPAWRANAYENSTIGNQTSEWPSATLDAPNYSIPLTREIRLPLATAVSFKVRLVDGVILHGNLLESGGGCFTFFVMDEEAFLSHAKYGSLARAEGKVYVSAMPVHYAFEFEIDSDRTGDYYFVLINPAGSCHGKIVSISLDYQIER